MSDERHTGPSDWTREDEKDRELVNYLQSIGASSLARELQDLRFRTRVVENQRALDAMTASMAFEETFADKIEQRIIANHSIMFDKAQAYTNFIVTLGYASFFAIWSYLKDEMHAWDMKLVGALLGTSLFIFVT